MFTFNRHTRLREMVSAYIDGKLTERERAVIETHLPQCESCRAEFEAMRATSEALRALPAVAAPRSFALTPDMVGTPRRASAAQSPVLNTAMRVSAASLAVALAAVMIADRGGGGFSGDSDSAGSSRLSEAGGGEPILSADTIGEREVGMSRGGVGDTAEGAAAPTAGDSVAGAAPDATPDADSAFDMAIPASPQASANADEREESTAAPPEEEVEVPSGPAATGDDGIGAIGVSQIVLAVLFGSTLGGTLALTAARRYGVSKGTNLPR
jgi:anti-sigma factor RsiW